MSTGEPAWSRRGLTAPHEEPDKAARVRRMFDCIAPRYAFVNSLFSVGRDAAWRREAVRLTAICDDDDVLDVACGTGDFAVAFVVADAKSVVGCDFAHQMLIRAAGSNLRGLAPVRDSPAAGDTARTNACVSRWCEADALRLPFRSGSFSICSCAFGVRNFADLDVGLREMYRVLRRGGRAVILEFTRPGNRVVRSLYELYSNRFMPIAATIISGDKSGAYRYLPRSVVMFLDAEQMCSRLRHVGFGRVTATPLTMGIVNVYVATRE